MDLRLRDYQEHTEEWGAGAVGAYRGVPDDIYHAHPACSNSRLTLLKRSPAHLKYERDHPQPITKALRIGSATHMAMLQPDLFFERYRVALGDRRTKEGKAAYAAIVDEVGEEYVLSSSEWDQIRAMSAAAWQHPYVMGLMEARPSVEVSALWRMPVRNDGEYWPLCKSRIDAFHPDYGVIDFKTTENASPEEFGRSIYRWGYHRQAAFYYWAAALVGLVPLGAKPRFTFVVIEKTPPYLVAVYELAPEALQAGAEQLRPLLAYYGACERDDLWPGYGNDPITIDLPNYAYRQIYDEPGF